MTNAPWLSDPYWKLKPMPPTPAEEICACARPSEWLLRGAVGPNPLACATCNREVLVENTGLSPQLADEVAAWRSFFECFYNLWLDSAEFEVWARQELESPSSVVNLRGLAAREHLAALRPTYYWWFQDTGRQGFVAFERCPLCQRPLQRHRQWLACSECHVVVAN